MRKRGRLRYYDYERTVAGQQLLGSVLTSSVASPYSERSSKTSGWLTKWNVNYEFSPRLMTYVSASQGYRPGGANNIPRFRAVWSLTHRTACGITKPAKSRWFGNALTANVSVFQINWKDIQVAARTADGLYSFLTNAGGARIRGVEAELAAEPVRGLSLTASLGYLDAKLTSDQVLTEFQNATMGGKKGDRLGSAPWSASATAAYVWPVSARWKGLLRADYSYSGKGRVGFTTTDPYYTEYGDFSVLNLRAGCRTIATAFSCSCRMPGM